jgi:hypothetical protein
LVSARDAINTILELSEVGPTLPGKPGDPEPDIETAEILKSIMGSMGEITAKLK